MILYKPYTHCLLEFSVRHVIYWGPISVYIHKYKLCCFINSESILIFNAPIFFGFYIEKNEIIFFSNNVYDIHNSYLFNIIYFSFNVYES